MSLGSDNGSEACRCRGHHLPERSLQFGRLRASTVITRFGGGGPMHRADARGRGTVLRGLSARSTSLHERGRRARATNTNQLFERMCPCLPLDLLRS